MIQHVHGDRSDHGDLLGIILEDEDHVKVLQLELDALKVDQLDVAQRHHERRLGRGWGKNYNKRVKLTGNEVRQIQPKEFNEATYPVCEVNEAVGGGLEEHGLPVRHSVESELPEGDVELHVTLCHLVYLQR